MEFLLGVGASLLATLLWHFYDLYIAHRPLVGLFGEWFEVIPQSPDRKYSIGEIHWDRKNKMYRFDGVNFTNDGDRICKWESISFTVDARARKAFYIFKASFFNELNKENYGFGVLNLQELDDGRLAPVDGHYIEAHGKGVPYSHSMDRLPDIIKRLEVYRGVDLRQQFHKRIVKAYHKNMPSITLEPTS